MANRIIDNGESGLVVREKLNDNFTELYINKVGATVESYGAVGNGTTDDWAAIQQCFNENDIVVFGKKTYKVNSTILSTAHKTVYFNGCTLMAGAYIHSIIRIQSPTDTPIQMIGVGKLYLEGNNFAKLGLCFEGGASSQFDWVSVNACRLWGVYIAPTTGNGGIVFNLLKTGFNGHVVDAIGSYSAADGSTKLHLTNMTAPDWESKKVYELLDNEFYQFTWIIDESGYNKNGAGETISSHRAFYVNSAVTDIIDKTQGVATLLNRYGNWVNSDYVNKPCKVLLGGGFMAVPVSEGVLTIHNYHSARNPVGMSFGMAYGVYIGKFVSHYDILLVGVVHVMNMHIGFIYGELIGVGQTNFKEPWNSLLFGILIATVKITVGGCLLAGTRQRTILDENVCLIPGVENTKTSYRPVIDVGYYSKMLGYENKTDTTGALRTYVDEYSPKVLAYKRVFNTTTNTITLDLQNITNIHGNGFVPVTIYFHKISNAGTFRIGLSNNLINNGYSLLDGVNNKLEFDPSTLPERFKATIMMFEKEFMVAIEAVYANQIATPLRNLIFGISKNTIIENNSVGDVIGNFQMINALEGDTFTYSLVNGDGDIDNGSFTVDGIDLKAAEIFDYETKSSYSIRVKSTKQDNSVIEKIFNISVTYDWIAISDFTLDNNIVSESSVVDAFDEADVGYFHPVGAEVGNQFTYEFAIGTGDDDNESFRIEDNLLVITEMVNMATKPTYSIRVKSIDLAGNTLEKNFTINATDQDLAPTDIQLSYTEVSEATTVGTEVGMFTTTDPDSGGTFIYELVAGTGGDDNASFTITNDRLYTAQLFDYATKSSYTIRVRTTDGTGQSFEKIFVITINEAQLGPNLVVNGTFDTDTDWNKDTGWTIADGKAVATSVPYGDKLVQSNVVSSAGTYRVTYTVSDYVSGSVRPEIGFDVGTTISGNGTYTDFITSGSNYLQFRSRTAGTTLKIDNVEVRKLI